MFRTSMDINTQAVPTLLTTPPTRSSLTALFTPRDVGTSICPLAADKFLSRQYHLIRTRIPWFAEGPIRPTAP